MTLVESVKSATPADAATVLVTGACVFIGWSVLGDPTLMDAESVAVVGAGFGLGVKRVIEASPMGISLQRSRARRRLRRLKAKCNSMDSEFRRFLERNIDEWHKYLRDREFGADQPAVQLVFLRQLASIVSSFPEGESKAFNHVIDKLKEEIAEGLEAEKPLHDMIDYYTTLLEGVRGLTGPYDSLLSQLVHLEKISEAISFPVLDQTLVQIEEQLASMQPALPNTSSGALRIV